MSHRGQAGADLVHERRRTAQVGLGVARRVELGEQRRGETARAVEVAAFAVVRAGTAVVDAAADVRERERGARAPRWRRRGRGRCARRAATRSPDRNAPPPARGAWRGPASRRCPALISSTGAVRPVEDEGAARCCDVELVADGEPGVEIAAGGAVVLPLDGDAVGAGAGRSRQRVVPEHRSLRVVGLDSQREVLAGACAAAALRRRGPRGGSRSPSRSRGRSPATVSRRNPGQAGGGLVTARPALPPPGSPSSRARNDACQPGLSAGMRSARSSCCRVCPGR